MLTEIFRALTQMPQAEFETAIFVLERPKTEHVFVQATTVISEQISCSIQIRLYNVLQCIVYFVDVKILVLTDRQNHDTMR
jgi:hypothetical protein